MATTSVTIRLNDETNSSLEKLVTNAINKTVVVNAALHHFVSLPYRDQKTIVVDYVYKEPEIESLASD